MYYNEQIASKIGQSERFWRHACPKSKWTKGQRAFEHESRLWHNKFGTTLMERLGKYMKQTRLVFIQISSNYMI